MRSCASANDARLLPVRELLFGARITSTTLCPRFSERLEWESEVADFCVNDANAVAIEVAEPSEPSFAVRPV